MSNPLMQAIVHSRRAAPGTSSVERNDVQGILDRYRNLNFVQRILNPDAYPKLDLGGGQHATHQMAWTTADGKAWVYPTVIFDPSTRQLRQLAPEAAWEHAAKTGERIPFDNDFEADWFSQRYKAAWER